MMPLFKAFFHLYLSKKQLMYLIVGIAAVLIIVLLIMVWVIYNRLVAAQNIVDEAFSGIDIQLKKRFELIPNLIEAVKGYNSYEAETLQKIVEQRSASGKNVDAMAENDRSITGALRTFRVLVEDYPDLKANVQFLKLMDALSEVENELAMARRYFNGATRDLNTKIEVFPAVLVAKLLNLKKGEFYRVSDDEREVQTVDL
jgi:LemA protein